MNNLEKIELHLQRNEIEPAITKLNEVTTINPDNGYAFYLKAKCYAKLNNDTAALENLRKAIQLDGTFQEAVNQDIADFGSLRLNPFFAMIHFDLLLSKIIDLMQAGNFEKAAIESHNILKTENYNPVIFYFLSICELELNNFEGAINAIDSYIKVNPSLVDAYFTKASIVERQKKFDEAILLYEKVLKMNPKHSNSYYNLGMIFLNKGEDTKAVNYFSEAINIHPRFTLALYKRAISFSRLNEVEKATADLNTAIGIDPRVKASALENSSLAKLID